MSEGTDYTLAELMVCALAREISDGDLLGQGLGTHLPTVAYFLAKATHAPDCCLLYSTGGSLSYRFGRIGLTAGERLALDAPVRKVGYAEVVCDTLPSLPFKEFSRPAQVDRFGNTNNMVIGPYDAPKVRFPGAGGIPDFSPYPSHASYLYLPRHDRRCLVDRIDFRTGLGREPGEGGRERSGSREKGPGPRKIITDLGVIEFTDRGAVLASTHPGVTAERVCSMTGFELIVPDPTAQTPPPTDEQLQLIRTVIDPDGLRELEFVVSADRLALIRSLVEREAEGLEAAP